MELQRSESWEDVPLEFSRLSIDSVIVSVALGSCDPSYPVFPSFVGLRILMDPSKTQHRNRKDVDFRALEIDNGFVTNQWQLFPWMIFPINFVHVISLFLFAHQFFWDVEHFLQGEICGILDGVLIIQEILSHECRRIHRCSHEHSPNYWMLFTWLCNVRHSFLSFSNLIFYFIHKFCCVTSHDESFGICLFLVFSTIRLPRSITKYLSAPCGLRISVEKSIFMMRTNLLHRIPRSFLRFPRSIVRRSPTFPLLRRPRSTIILFWITCWWRSIRFPWSIVSRNRFPRILIFVPCPPWVWWSWRRHNRSHPRS